MIGESPSSKRRFLGSIAGVLVGAVLGTLIGMGINNILLAAVIGGSIGLIFGFCCPNVATYMFDGLIDIP